MSFAKLKQNRTSSISKLVEAAEKISSNTKSGADDRFWQPQCDKAGNGYAVIRFLPAAEGDDLPWIRYWEHGFKGPTGRWYIEKSLTSLGQPDPVSEANAILWNSGMDEDKALVRERKRKLHYISNILIVSDPTNPENEGKVFLYKYGKKIYDKIIEAMQPQFADEEPLNPFDFWAGANFKLKIRQVEGYRNFDKSEFDKVAALFGGDDTRLEELYAKLNPLKEFIDPSKYKTYDELKKQFIAVVGGEVTNYTPAETATLDETRSAPAPKVSAQPEPEAVGGGNDSDDDGDSLAYFAKLARG